MFNSIMLAIQPLLFMLFLSPQPHLYEPSQVENINLSGRWLLKIDPRLNGVAESSNGCRYIILNQCGAYNVTGLYETCVGGNAISTGMPFEGTIRSTDRGTVIHLFFNNTKTNYVGSWSGNLVDSNTIKGVTCDMQGEYFDFEMKKQ